MDVRSQESLEDEVIHLRECLQELTSKPKVNRYVEGVYLTPTQARLAHHLRQRKFLTHGQTILYLYWDRDADSVPLDQNVKAQVCYINRAFEEAGKRRPIRSVWGEGYEWVG